MNRFLKKLLILVITLIPKIFLVTKSFAVTNTLIINELYPNPNPDEKEWIEIYNDSSENIQLTGWILMDEVSTPSIIFEFSDEQTIEPLSFFVVELPTNKLNNSGDAVKLINNNQEIVSQFEYSNSESSKSFSLDQNGEVILSSPTKGEANNLNTQTKETDESSGKDNQNQVTQSYPDLFIHEVLACPKDDNPESITLQNSNETSVNLNNWKIKDLANNIIVLSDQNVANKLDLTTIYLTKNILNNSGDTIFLLDPNENLIDQFSYSDCGNETNNKANTEDATSTEDQTDQSSNEPTNTTNHDIAANLKKINQLLKLTNPDKSLTENTEPYISQQIVIKHKDLPKSAIISVIIGGAIISSSSLIFIKNEKI